MEIMNKYIDFLTKFISEKNGFDEKEINISANMFENGYMDSLGLFGLLIDLETTFGTTLDENDILDSEAVTIEGLANILSKKSK